MTAPVETPTAAPVNLQVGDRVRRRHGRTPAQREQVGRIEQLLPRYRVRRGVFIPYARVRFPGTWARFGGGAGGAVVRIQLTELVRAAVTS